MYFSKVSKGPKNDTLDVIYYIHYVIEGDDSIKCSSQNRQSAKLFLQSSRKWDSPTPSPAGECALPFLVGGGGTLARGRGGGGSQIRRGDTHCDTL